MPSKSAKQHRFMEAVAHNPKFAKKAGIPQSVGADFAKADKGKKFAGGGDVKESKAMAKKEIAVFKKAGRPDLVKHEKAEYGMKKGGKTKCMAKGGAVRSSADGCATKGKTKGRQV